MKVSVIIPGAYPKYVALVIESVMQQTVFPHEFIVSEDGKQEEMRILIEKYKKKVPFILKHISTPKDGFRPSLARNRGVSVSTGDLLIFSDGDLLLHPKFIEDFSSVCREGESYIGSRAFINQSKTQKFLEQGFLPKSFFWSWYEKNTLNAIRISQLYKLFPVLKKADQMRGGLLGVHRNDYVRVNGYDEAFVGWGREDTDFVCRLHFTGVKLRKLKFMGLTRHLWHTIEGRDRLSHNDELLAETLRTKKVYCEKGLDKHV